MLKVFATPPKTQRAMLAHNCRSYACERLSGHTFAFACNFSSFNYSALKSTPNTRNRRIVDSDSIATQGARHTTVTTVLHGTKQASLRHDGLTFPVGLPSGNSTVALLSYYVLVMSR